jgi:hypothetical protein
MLLTVSQLVSWKFWFVVEHAIPKREILAMYLPCRNCLILPLVQQLVTALLFLEAYTILGRVSISVNSAIYHDFPFANYLWPLYGIKIY